MRFSANDTIAVGGLGLEKPSCNSIDFLTEGSPAQGTGLIQLVRVSTPVALAAETISCGGGGVGGWQASSGGGVGCWQDASGGGVPGGGGGGCAGAGFFTSKAVLTTAA